MTTPELVSIILNPTTTKIERRDHLQKLLCENLLSFDEDTDTLVVHYDEVETLHENIQDLNKWIVLLKPTVRGPLVTEEDQSIEEIKQYVTRILLLLMCDHPEIKAAIGQNPTHIKWLLSMLVENSHPCNLFTQLAGINILAELADGNGANQTAIQQQGGIEKLQFLLNKRYTSFALCDAAEIALSKITQPLKATALLTQPTESKTHIKVQAAPAPAPVSTFAVVQTITSTEKPPKPLMPVDSLKKSLENLPPPAPLNTPAPGGLARTTAVTSVAASQKPTLPPTAEAKSTVNDWIEVRRKTTKAKPKTLGTNTNGIHGKSKWASCKLSSNSQTTQYKSY